MTRRWPMLRILLSAHLSFVLIGWLVLLVVTAMITIGITLWGNVGQSVWHFAATQVPRWVAAGLGMDAITTYLRMHVAHGRTRRDFLRQLWPYFVGLAAAMALVVTIGYQIERGVFAMTGWSQELPDDPLFGSASQIPGIFGTFTMLFLLWAVAGALLTAAFTRGVLFGLPTIPLALLTIAPGDILAGTSGVPIVRDFAADMGIPTLPSLGFCVLGLAIGVAGIWGFVRDMPMRPRVA